MLSRLLIFPLTCYASASMAQVLTKESPKLAHASPSAAALQVIVGLLVVTVCIFALAWLVKRLGGGSFMQGQGIKLLASIPLGAREKAVLIEVENQKILVGVAPGRVCSLHVFEKSASAPAVVGELALPTAVDTQPDKKDFNSFLKNILSPGESK